MNLQGLTPSNIFIIRPSLGVNVNIFEWMSLNGCFLILSTANNPIQVLKHLNSYDYFMVAIPWKHGDRSIEMLDSFNYFH